MNSRHNLFEFHVPSIKKGTESKESLQARLISSSSLSQGVAGATGVLCGAAASGNFTWTAENVAKSIVCMMMSGPFLTGYCQTINDYYDREMDAINEPYRPIPSGTQPSLLHALPNVSCLTAQPARLRRKIVDSVVLLQSHCTQPHFARILRSELSHCEALEL